jgi:RHS repeat-associated protein
MPSRLQHVRRVVNVWLMVALLSSSLPLQTVQSTARPTASIDATTPAPLQQDDDPTLLVPIDSEPVPNPEPPPASQLANARIATDGFERLPLDFVPNVGQFDPSIRYQARGSGGVVSFLPQEVAITVLARSGGTPLPNASEAVSATIAAQTVRMTLDGINPTTTLTASERLPGIVHYYLGNDPALWKTDVPTYAGIAYQHVYAGIDLHYDGADGALKSTYYVAPGSDPAQIRWRYTGISGIQIDSAGNLLISVPITVTQVPTITVPITPTLTAVPVDQTAALTATVEIPTVIPTLTPALPTATPTLPVEQTIVLTLTEQAPIAWQDIGDSRVAVQAQFVLNGDGSVGFGLGAYDANQPLVIDPVLTYSSYLGGGGYDVGNKIDVDYSGASYIIGESSSVLFNSSQTRVKPVIFVAKVNATGTNRVYTTFLGSESNISNSGNDIAVTKLGDAHITGVISGDSFPLKNPIPGNTNTTNYSAVAFLSRLDYQGQLVYSTFWRGSGNGICIITTCDSFGQSIAVDSTDRVYLVGSTTDPDFPLQQAFDTSYADGGDAFVTRFVWNGTSLSYNFSSYFGGNNSDDAKAVAIAESPALAIYVTGSTFSDSGLAVGTAYDSSYNGFGDVLIAKFTPNASPPTYISYWGGNAYDEGRGIAVDATGAAYITGTTESNGLATTGTVDTSFGGSSDAFVVKFTSSGSRAYATYLGGTSDDAGNDITVDLDATALVVGQTVSSDFVLPNPITPRGSGTNDGFLASLTATAQAYAFTSYLGASEYGTSNGITLDEVGASYMTGVVSGSLPTLGINNGSGDAYLIRFGAVLPYRQNGAPERCPCAGSQPSTPFPVNTRTGNFWTTVTDLTVESAGPAIAWQRTYQSHAITETGSMGAGWQHSYAARLFVNGDGSVEIYTPMGNRFRFDALGGGAFRARPGIYDSLTLSGGTYIQTLRDQSQYHFAAATGRLTAVIDPQGLRVNLYYPSGNLDQIVDAQDNSRFLNLTYQSGQLRTISDGTRTVTYTYTVNNLTTVADVLNRPTTYVYAAGTSLLQEIKNPLSQRVEYMEYDTATPRRVKRQDLHDGQRLDFQYLAASTVITTTGLDGRVDKDTIFYSPSNLMTGRQHNNQHILGTSFDSAFNPGNVRDGRNKATDTTYLPNGLPVETTDPTNAKTRRTYDAKNNLLSISDALNITTRYRYDQYNNVISMTMGITTSSPLRSTTLYTYSYNVRYAGDSLLREVRAPDGVVTRYAYFTTGSIARQGQISQMILGYGTALAQTTSYDYNSRGLRIDVTTGVGTPLQRLDRTFYRADNTIARTVQNYKNDVFTPAAPDEDIMTTYGYDLAGRQVWVQDALGRRSVTHYNDKGQVDWTARNVQPFQTDGQGQVTFQAYSVANPDRNVATLYRYDGLGRTSLVTETGILTGTFNVTLLQFTTAISRTTRTEYDSLSRPMTVTLNFLPGQPSNSQQNVKLYTRYDAAGNPTEQTDGIGRITLTEYDALNRIAARYENYEDGKASVGSSTGDRTSYTFYDQLGRIAELRENVVKGYFDPTEPISDRVTLYTYDNLSRVITTTVNASLTFQSTDPANNRVSVNQYDPATTRLLATRDPLGRWTNMQYDVLGRVSDRRQNCRNSSGLDAPTGCMAYNSAYHDVNIRTHMDYDALGRVTDVHQNYINGLYNTNEPDRDIRTNYQYDGLGRTIRTVESYDNAIYNSATPDRDIITRRAYDALGRTTIITDVLSAETRYGYNGLDQTTVITDSMGRVTRYGYDGSGTQRWSMTPDGRLTVYYVDELGRVTTTIQNYQDGINFFVETESDLTTRMVYDAAGRRTRRIDPAGRETVFAYDNLDRLITVTENYIFVLFGTCTAARTDCNVQTQYHYDRADNLIRVIDGRGNTVQRAEYNAAHEQIRRFDGLNQETSFSYDAVGRMTQTVDPRPGVTYDLVFGYNNLDRPTGTTGVGLNIRHYYDGLGRRTGMLDISGTTNFAVDALGRTTAVTATNTGTIGYTYNGRSERTQITYPTGPTITYTYFNDGQLHMVKQGATTLAEYSYDAAGRLSQVARANGSVTNYGYDGADRLKAVRTLSKGSLAAYVDYSLDKLGLRTFSIESFPTVTPRTTRLKTITFEAGSLVNNTSGADLQSSTVLLNNQQSMKEFYDARFNIGTSDNYLREDMTATDELYVTLYLKIHQLPTGTSRIVLLRNSGTSVGNLALTSSGTLQLRNGTSVIGTSAALSLNTIYRIGIRQKKGTGANGILQAVLTTGDTAFGTPFAQSTTQTFTSQVNEVRVGNTGAPWSSLSMDDIALDTAGFAEPSSITTSFSYAYEYDGLNRLTNGAGTAYSYDRSGNRTDGGRSYNAANQDTGLSYDEAGNLLNDGFTSRTYDALNRMLTNGSTSYRYNGDGTLVRTVTGSTTTYYTQDLAAPLSQVLQTVVGSTRTSYLYGRERLAVEGTPKTWYLHDGLGSVRRTLNDAGNVLATTDYDPWGVPYTTPSTPFGFAGELQTGNQLYLRARWYKPGSGQFTSRDPFAGMLETPYSLHPYQYAYSNPVLWTDPSGEIVIFFHGGWDDTSIDPLIKELSPMIKSDILELKANDTSVAYRALDKFNDPMKCFVEPIILIGYSRGGASVQAAANTLNIFYRHVKINLALTIGPVEAFHGENVPRYKLPNVARQISFLSDQGLAAIPLPRAARADDFSLFKEFFINGAENIQVPETSHFSVVEEPMTLYRPYQARGRKNIHPPSGVRYAEKDPSPVWQRIKKEIRLAQQ